MIDDHPLIHDGVRKWCQLSDPPIDVAMTCVHPDEFLAADPPVPADVVILDLEFGGAPDRGSLQRILTRGYRVIVLSHHVEPDLVLDCIDLGVSSYLGKGESPEHLAAAVHAAAAGDTYDTTTTAKALLLGRSAHRPGLSDREVEVLQVWLQAGSKQLAADRLLITAGTVETHVARIRAKYAAVGRPAPSKAALLARALEDGLITTDQL